MGGIGGGGAGMMMPGMGMMGGMVMYYLYSLICLA
jgi:hypothetical protein